MHQLYIVIDSKPNFALSKVKNIAETWKEANSIASIDVNEILTERTRKLTESIEACAARLETKREKLDASIINDMEEHLQQKKDNLCSITNLMPPLKDKKQEQKLNQMRKRRALRLFGANRVKND